MNFPGQVEAVINYDRFHLAEAAAAAWFDLVERNSQSYFSRSTRHSSSLLFCRQMGEEFDRHQAPLNPPVRQGQQRGEHEPAIS